MAELLPGVHQIPINYNGRPLRLYLLLGAFASVLMDTGDAGVPEKDILPYFDRIGFKAADLTYLMITHPDVDHTGGLARMHRAAPQARVICGAADRSQVEEPEVLVERRYRLYYREHGVGPDDAAKAKLLPRCGGPVATAFTFTGGEELRLGPDQMAQILHLPGHARGHLGVWLPWAQTAIIADAVHETANRYLDGRAAFAPTYMQVDDYLGTIRQLEALRPQRLYSCHWADQETPEQVQAFLSRSRDYALHAEAVILETVKAAGRAGLTLREVMARAKPMLGDWPAERDADTRFMAMGHLERLIGQGLLVEERERPPRFRYAPRWSGMEA